MPLRKGMRGARVRAYLFPKPDSLEILMFSTPIYQKSSRFWESIKSKQRWPKLKEKHLYQYWMILPSLHYHRSCSLRLKTSQVQHFTYQAMMYPRWCYWWGWRWASQRNQWNPWPSSPEQFGWQSLRTLQKRKDSGMNSWTTPPVSLSSPTWLGAHITQLSL